VVTGPRTRNCQGLDTKCHSAEVAAKARRRSLSAKCCFSFFPLGFGFFLLHPDQPFPHEGFLLVAEVLPVFSPGFSYRVFCGLFFGFEACIARILETRSLRGEYCHECAIEVVRVTSGGGFLTTRRHAARTSVAIVVCLSVLLGPQSKLA